MNETQTIFLVFYAIFWGTAANAQPRWKAFQLPLFFPFSRVTCRVLLSFITFNLLPIFYFGWTIWVLSGPQLAVHSWTPGSVARLLLHSVLPAFAAFGFYRLWIGIVELNPKLFYFEFDQGIPPKYREVEPSLQRLAIKTGLGARNIFWAIAYIVVGLASSQILR